MQEETRFVLVADMAISDTFESSSYDIPAPPPPRSIQQIEQDPVGNPDKRVLAMILRRPALPPLNEEGEFRRSGAPDMEHFAVHHAGSLPAPDRATLSSYSPSTWWC